MPKQSTADAHYYAEERYRTAAADLHDATQRLAFEKIVDLFPSSHTLNVFGDDEGSNFTPRLRVATIVDADGKVLYDAQHGTDDRELQEKIEEVETELLDHLIDLHPDDWYGESAITAADVA